jgi:hypothetical protein
MAPEMTSCSPTTCAIAQSLSTHSHYFVERTGDLFERLLTEEPSEVSSD